MLNSEKLNFANYTGYDVAFLNKKGGIGLVYASQGIADYRLSVADSSSTSELKEITGGLPVLFECSRFFHRDNQGHFYNGLPHTSPNHYILVGKDVADYANRHNLYRGIVFPRKFEITEDGLMIISELGTFYYSIEK